MMRQLFAGLSLAALALWAGGCAGFQYRGLTPTVRTFADEPTIRDYYMGMDLRFAVLEPADERRLAEATAVRAKMTGMSRAAAAEKVIEEDEPDDAIPDQREPIPPPPVP